ncbi:MAG: hypothetical protein PVI19_16685, partial [Syntrophobacterales bacterium]
SRDPVSRFRISRRRRDSGMTVWPRKQTFSAVYGILTSRQDFRRFRELFDKLDEFGCKNEIK